MVDIHVTGPSGTAAFEWVHNQEPAYATAREAIGLLYRALKHPDRGETAWTEGMRSEAMKIGLQDLEEAYAVVQEMEGESELSGPSDGFNLKKILMELGNELVTRHGYAPAEPFSDEFMQKVADDDTTNFLKAVTVWLNARPEAQQILKRMNVDWPMPRGRGRG